MELLIAWIARNPGKTALVAVVAALCLFAGVQTLRLSWAQIELADKKAELAEVYAEVVRQSEAVDRWQEEGERAKEKAREAEKGLAKLREQHRRTQAELAAANVPEKCEEATAWGAEESRKLAEGWR